MEDTASKNYFRRALLRFIIVSLISTLCACSKEPEGETIPAGSLMADSIRFQFAIYYLPRPSRDPMISPGR